LLSDFRGKWYNKNTMPNIIQTPTENDLKALAAKQGQKLGFLIAALNVSDEVKEAFFDLLPHLSLEQLERLTNILESKYLSQQTSGPDEKLKAELEAIKSNSDAQEDAADKEALADLKQLAIKII